MLAGTRHLTLDAKGRVVMPAPFRRLLGRSIVLTRGPEGAILAFSEREWSKHLHRNASSETFALYFVASSWRVTPDLTSGRILLPVVLREHAELRAGAEVAVAGLGSAVAICDRARWDARMRYQETRVLAALSGPEWPQVRTYAHLTVVDGGKA